MTSHWRLCGFFLKRKERWSLTLPGKTLVAALVLVVASGLLHGLFSFLAITRPNREGIMVVDGWICESSVPQVVREFAASRYQSVVVVNAEYGPGDPWESGSNHAEHVATVLARLGIPRERIALVICDVVRKDRTYHTALAVKKWAAQQKTPAKSFDIVTVGAHARRSRLLFEKAFAPDIRIGVIALEAIEFDPLQWWRSSEGVREVPFEGLAYLYVRLFFNPTPDDGN